MPADAMALSGLDDFVALDLIGSEQQTEETPDGQAGTEAPAEQAEPEPLMDAGANSFAEALAQEYTPEEGTFELTPESRFYIATTDDMPPEDLLSTVRLMDSEFAAYSIPSEKPLAVVYGDERFASEGDIVISLVREDEFLAGIVTADIFETYKLYIDEKNIIVEACGTDGIWYGLTELLEIAREMQNIDAAQAGEPDTADGETAADDTGATGKADALKLACCRIKDGPDLAERAVMLDCGRKYFSKEWIENLIRRASLQRYNAIVLHFAEAEGIRLDSPEFPWLTEDIDSLSTAEMREIVELAKQYHMEVIPSFDTPGHNKFMVKRYAKYVDSHPDFSFTYDGKTYDSSVKGFGSIANHYSHGGETEKVNYIGIDLTKEHAVAFTNALIDSYADLFRELGCSKMDIGSDELLGWYTFELGGDVIDYDNRWDALEHWAKYARKTLGIDGGSASDVFISYINDLADRLETKGYTCRVFNDEIDINPDQHVQLSETVEITYWFDGDNTAGHFAKKGHVVYNFMESWCFYVLREINGKDIMKGKYRTVDGRYIFVNWDPRSFARKAGVKMIVPDEMLGGGYFAIWCDSPGYKDAATVWKETKMRTWANASRMWNCEVNSPASGIRAAEDYEMMKAFAESMNGFPGWTGDSGSAAVLPAASEAEEGATWIQKLIY